MKILKVLDPRICTACSSVYTPKPGGHNARYCSKRCKVRRKPKAIYDPAKRSKWYHEGTKLNPVSLAKHRAGANANRQAVRRWLGDYKTSRGCVDCGFNVHYAALQLDHLGKKTANISELRSSIKRLLEEIEKGQCVVRCSNCHAVKTWATKNKLEYKPGMACVYPEIGKD